MWLLEISEEIDMGGAEAEAPEHQMVMYIHRGECGRLLVFFIVTWWCASFFLE